MNGKMPLRGGGEEDSKSMQILIEALIHGSTLDAYASNFFYFSYLQMRSLQYFSSLPQNH